LINNNMVIVPHPPYPPELEPCDFALFPKVSDIQRISQEVLHSVKENNKVLL
jgi:hypothetical protein